MTSIADRTTATNQTTTLTSRSPHRPHSRASMAGALITCDRLVDGALLRTPTRPTTRCARLALSIGVKSSSVVPGY